MREIGDGFDILVGLLALILMITACAWSLACIRRNSEILVDEKSAIHNVYGIEAEEPERTAKDALMSLVVNDAYVPDPASVVFRYGASTYTINFDTSYFEDKEVSINKAWAEFFSDKMDTKIASTELDLVHGQWIVQLVP